MWSFICMPQLFKILQFLLFRSQMVILPWQVSEWKLSYFLLFRYTCSGSWEQVSARGSRGSGQWCVKSPRVIRSQVETTQSLARVCDEPEMRTTRRCNIQSSHWGASCYRVTIIITRSHAPNKCTTDKYDRGSTSYFPMSSSHINTQHT